MHSIQLAGLASTVVRRRRASKKTHLEGIIHVGFEGCLRQVDAAACPRIAACSPSA